MLRKIRNLFLAGLLVLLPLVLSVTVFWYLFINIDRLTRPLVTFVFGGEIRGIGFVLTILFIFAAGIFATNFIGRKIINFGESILVKIPLFNNIYMAIKQILEGLFTHHKTNFKKAILFEYPRRGVYQIGFITRESSPILNEEIDQAMYNVFVPTAPNPTSGMFVMVPKKEVIILDIPIEEALKMVISGGLLSPEEIETF
ncbi:MAG: DUF502 domain-containing protein [bacterium]